MKAVCWQGKGKVGVEQVPDPRILNPGDAIIQVSSTAICGSDLHLYSGRIPAMCRGDILGHEFMGEVVEVGPAVKRLRVGDRVVVPFNIACGRCVNCRRGLWSACDNSNPNRWALELLNGVSSSGLFGYSHLYGGYAGGQAEYVRVPYAEVGPLLVPSDLNDEQALFLSDVLPTAYMAAENCAIERGDVVAVWGLGPVGQLAVQCAFLLGAERVIAIDRVPKRLQVATAASGVEIIDYAEGDVHEALMERTGGQGPDACIDAVGMEAHGTTLDALYDDALTFLGFRVDRLHALRQAIRSCRKGGTVSIPGVYGGLVDRLNLGAAFGKALTLKMGQTHTHRYMRLLLQKILAGEIDASFIVSHRMSLADAARAYAMFQRKEEGCTKIILSPRRPVLH